MIERKILLNPGPATTTDTVKQAQVVSDICHREKEFTEVLEFCSKNLIKIAGGDEGYACVFFGGSGTAGMDAVINSVVNFERKVLILNNGAYGERFIKISKAYSTPYVEINFNYGKIDLKKVEETLKNDPSIGYIAAIHHETTTGRLNPIRELGEIAKRFNCAFIVDAISSFAGIPFSVKDYQIDFMVSTSNKCIQGMAGICFVICKKEELEKIKNYPKKSFYLNLYEQYNYFNTNSQPQFTPPVQTFYALKKAIEEYLEEGAEQRYERYKKCSEVLVKGMAELGFRKLLEDSEESKILTAFFLPENIDFDKMHDSLYKRGFTIYPGKVEKLNTFRIANMGAINYADINNFLISLREVLKEV